ncbi:hypothetical protein SLA2020_404880 [Shorea laevis]
MLMRLATEAADNEEAYAFVEMMVKEMHKKVHNDKKGSSIALDNETQLSLSDGNEIANHTQSVEKLLEMVKGLKKKEGKKCGKRLRGWVEKQPKKTTKRVANDNIDK